MCVSVHVHMNVGTNVCRFASVRVRTNFSASFPTPPKPELHPKIHQHSVHHIPVVAHVQPICWRHHTHRGPLAHPLLWFMLIDTLLAFPLPSPRRPTFFSPLLEADPNCSSRPTILPPMSQCSPPNRKPYLHTPVNGLHVELNDHVWRDNHRLTWYLPSSFRHWAPHDVFVSPRSCK